MAYTTVTDLQAFSLGMTLSATSRPTILQVEGWINEASAIIDSYLADVYITPITNSTDLLVVKDLCDQYVLANINFMLTKNRVGVQTNTEITPRNISYKGFYERLDFIIRNRVLRNTEVISASQACYSYNNTNGVTFKSSLTETQW